MSDYFQILKREIETKKEKLEPSSIEITEDREKKDDLSPTPLFVTKSKKDKPLKEKEVKKKFNSVNPPAVSRNALLEKESIWISLSEAANMGGVQTKTLRRAIKANKLKYKIVHNRYLVDFASLMKLLLSSRKLSNKLKEFGIGQYIKEWKDLD